MILALLLLAADPAPPAAPPAPPAAAPAAATPAPPVPTSAEIKKVVDYFNNGAAAGPVVIELVACKKAGKNADGKLACLEPLGDKAKKGDPLIAFVRFFVPKGGKYDDAKVKFLWNNEMRSTSDFTLSESFGYGIYKETTASKPGTWEMQVIRGDAVLASAKVVVE